MPGPDRITVGVAPAHVATSHRRLLAAAAAAYPVRFEGREPGDWAGLDAALLIGAAVGQAPPGMPALVCSGLETPGGAQAAIRLADGPPLHRALRGAVIHDAPPPALAAQAGDLPLASHEGGPVWLRRGAVAHAGWFPAELDHEEPLRARLRPRRSVALLPLAHLLDELTCSFAWKPVEQGAAFILDDPNLHRPRYGHVRFAEVRDHAERHGHHVVMAMIPLDAWAADRRAVAVFRGAPERLSLTLHGLEHDGAELGRITDADAARRSGVHALRRVTRFEARTGVPVARVMVPPHEALSEPAAAGLAAAGVTAFCSTRPYPWQHAPDEWLAAPAGAGPLTGWAPGQAAGRPMLLRHRFDFPPEDLAFRAFLGHPLIIYGHHQDLKEGLGPLEHWARLVGERGVSRWENLAALARRAVELRRRGSVLEVRPHARDVDVEVPSGVTAVRVVAPAGGVADGLTIAGDGGPLPAPAEPDEPWALPDEVPERLRVTQLTPSPVAAGRRHHTRPRAVVRRAVTELRDRLGAAIG